MEELASASLNVDVTKFLAQDEMAEAVSILQWQRKYNELVLFKMFEEGLNADIILTAQGGSVKAHRCVLSAVSPVFKAMFQHDMKEQLSSTVDIPDMSIEALQLFLLVLYTINEYIIPPELTAPGESEVPELEPFPWLFREGIDKYFNEFLRALSKYQAWRRRLNCLLKDTLLRILTPENCWEYYDISLQVNDEFNDEDFTLSTFARDYIVENFQTVVQSAEFLSEMRRNPDRVYSILDAGISSISEEAVRNHIQSQSN